jgi:hypothetical protein
MQSKNQISNIKITELPRCGNDFLNFALYILIFHIYSTALTKAKNDVLICSNVGGAPDARRASGIST